MLEERVGRQHAVVRLDDGGRDLRRRVDGEAQLRLLAVVDREALEQERAEARASAAADSVEEEEALHHGFSTKICQRARFCMSHVVEMTRVYCTMTKEENQPTYRLWRSKEVRHIASRYAQYETQNEVICPDDDLELAENTVVSAQSLQPKPCRERHLYAHDMQTERPMRVINRAPTEKHD